MKKVPLLNKTIWITHFYNEPVHKLKKKQGLASTPFTGYLDQDVKSAVEWLKEKIFTDTAFIEHLTDLQQKELLIKIDEAFPV